MGDVIAFPVREPSGAVPPDRGGPALAARPSTASPPRPSHCGARSSARCCARSATASAHPRPGRRAGRNVRAVPVGDRARPQGGVLGDARRGLRIARTEPGEFAFRCAGAIDRARTRPTGPVLLAA